MVGERGILEDGADGIQAEAVHAQVKPEADGRKQRLFDGRVAPVEVGLLLEKIMVVVEINLWHILPG